MELIELFKKKHNNLIDLTYKIHDTIVVGYKAFNGDEAIASITYSNGYYMCWNDNSQLISDDEVKVKYFLDL